MLKNIFLANSLGECLQLLFVTGIKRWASSEKFKAQKKIQMGWGMSISVFDMENSKRVEWKPFQADKICFKYLLMKKLATDVEQ